MLAPRRRRRCGRTMRRAGSWRRYRPIYEGSSAQGRITGVCTPASWLEWATTRTLEVSHKHVAALESTASWGILTIFYCSMSSANPGLSGTAVIAPMQTTGLSAQDAVPAPHAKRSAGTRNRSYFWPLNMRAGTPIPHASSYKAVCGARARNGSQRAEVSRPVRVLQ